MFTILCDSPHLAVPCSVHFIQFSSQKKKKNVMLAMFMCTDLTPGPEVKDMLIFVFLSVSSVCMLLSFFRKIKVILFLKDCDLSVLKI